MQVTTGPGGPRPRTHDFLTCIQVRVLFLKSKKWKKLIEHWIWRVLMQSKVVQWFTLAFWVSISVPPFLITITAWANLPTYVPTQRTKIKFHILISLLVQVITPNSVLSSSLARLWNFMFTEFSQLNVLHLIRLD